MRGKRKLSAREDMHIGRTASNQAISCKKIKAILGLEVSTRTIARSLNRGEHMVYAKKR